MLKAMTAALVVVLVGCGGEDEGAPTEWAETAWTLSWTSDGCEGDGSVEYFTRLEVYVGGDSLLHGELRGADAGGSVGVMGVGTDVNAAMLIIDAPSHWTMSPITIGDEWTMDAVYSDGGVSCAFVVTGVYAGAPIYN